MKITPILVALLFLAGCCTTPQPQPEPQPTEIKKHDVVIPPTTPAEQNAWPRRGWDNNQP